MESKTIVIYDAGEAGKAQVTDDVIGAIACLAATEVEGVDSVAGGVVTKFGKTFHSAGANVLVGEDGRVSVVVALVVKLGFVIPEVSNKVQENVKTAIENMTGLSVKKVDVRIANVKVDK